MTNSERDAVRSLIAALDTAVALKDPVRIAERIKAELSSRILEKSVRLPERFRRARAECYARRLLHRDPDLRYTAVVMTWGPGQGTPLHDHAGIWCVEAVVEGEMQVTQFDLVEDKGGLFRFEQQSRIHADVGSSGCLIPPFEYHVLQNAFSDRTSMTLHVYGGEMESCGSFEPREGGWYQRREKMLRYHD